LSFSTKSLNWFQYIFFNQIAMDIKIELKNALDIALLKKPVMHHVAENKSKTAFGYYVIIAAAILGAVGQQIFLPFFRPTLTSSLLTAVVQAIGIVIGIYIVSFIAKGIFKGQASHDQFFRVAAYGMIVMWLLIIPPISFIGGIWILVITFVILKTIHKLTTEKAIGTLLVIIIGGYLIFMILFKIGFWGIGGGFQMRGGDMMDFGRDEGFKFDIRTEEGVGRVEFGEGGMRITGEEGEVFEISIPDIE